MEAREQYRDRAYWNERFATEESFEWLLSPEEVLGKVSGKPRSSRILILGCGNSGLGSLLHSQGFHNVLNLDYSESLIERMKKQHEEMQWLCGDIRKLRELVDEGSADVIIDKATLDSLLVGQSPWLLSSEAEAEIQDVLKGISWALAPGAEFLSFTWAQPHHRIPLLARPRFHWSVRVSPADGILPAFCYSMIKGEELKLEPYKEYLSLAERARNFDNSESSLTLPYDDDPAFLFALQPD